MEKKFDSNLHSVENAPVSDRQTRAHTKENVVGFTINENKIIRYRSLETTKDPLSQNARLAQSRFCMQFSIEGIASQVQVKIVKQIPQRRNSETC